MFIGGKANALLIREIDHRQRGVINEVARTRAYWWIRIGRCERRDSPRGGVEAVLEKRQVALHVGYVEELVVGRNQDAVSFLSPFIDGRHGLSRQSIFTQAIDIEPPVPIADAEEERAAAIEAEVSRIIIQVNPLMARIAAISSQSHHSSGHLAPLSPSARDIKQWLFRMRGDDPAANAKVWFFGHF
jgi:hypothetical protein